MSNGSDDNGYEVGYGKPPKRSQFPPGVSGNKGRRKKQSESQKAMVARIRDEIVEIGGQKMDKLEIAIRSVFNTTIKGGKPRDLKILFEMLEKYGALSETDLRAEHEANAAKAAKRILSFFNHALDIDPADAEAVERDNLEEARIILACPTCGPTMKERWKDPIREARRKRYGSSGLQKQVDDLFMVKKS